MMRTPIIALFCLLIYQVAGQDSILKVMKSSYPIHPQNILKSNPMRILWGSIPLTSEYRINYETVMSKNTSQEIAISLYGKTPFLNANNANGGAAITNLRCEGLRFQYAYRFYLKGINRFLPPDGYYISPHFSYATARFYDKTQPRQRRDYIQVEHFDVNIFVGRQFVINRNLIFEIYAGGGYKKNRWFESYANGVRRQVSIIDFDYYNSNYRLHLGFNFGLGWNH